MNPTQKLQKTAPVRATNLPGMLGQAAAVLGLATVLGLAFNASNPIGIRFNEAAPAAAAVSPAAGARSTAAATPVLPAPPTEAPNLAPPPSLPVVTPGQGIAPGVSGQPAGGSGGSDGGSTATVSRQNPSATTWAKTHPIADVGGCLLVDARAPSAYEAGHIPGAVLLPQSSTDDEVRAFRDKHGTNTHLVVYCSSTSCSLSYKLAFRLVNEFGYGKVEYMTGGYQEWQRETSLASGTPGTGVAASPPILPDASADAPFRPVGIGWAELAKSYPAGQPQLVDIRSVPEFSGGHIDGAVPLHDRSTDAEIASFMQKYGPDRPLILYCEYSGCLDSIKFGTRLRRAGFKQVRHLDEGYQDWIKLAGRKTSNP